MPYHKWKDLKHKLSPETKAKIKKQVEKEVKMLRELRAARQYTQQTLAATMGKSQAAVSKIENGTDLYISTLRSYIEAMGGHLEVRAVFPDATIQIDQFSEEALVTPA